MAQTLCSVLLMGENTTNPGVPRHNVLGQLVADSSALQFVSGNTRYFIPWESIDKCEVETTEIGGMGCLKSFALFFGVSGIFSGVVLGMGSPVFLIQGVLGSLIFLVPVAVFSNVRSRIVIKHWNEEHGFDATVRFEIGIFTWSYTRAHDIVREIWGKRGDIRQKMHRSTKVQLP